MENGNSRIKSYIGFAVKSGAAVYGAENLERRRGKTHLTLMCRSLSENSAEKLLRVCEKRKIPLFEPLFPLRDVSLKDGCKVLSVTDKNLAEAIIKEIKGACNNEWKDMMIK